MECPDLFFSNQPLALLTNSYNVAWVLSTGGKIAIIALLAVSGLTIYQARKNFHKKNLLADQEKMLSDNDGVEKILRKCRQQIVDFLDKTSAVFTTGIESFITENLTELKNTITLKDELKTDLEHVKENIFSIATRFENSLHSGHYFIDLKDYQLRMVNSLTLLLDPLFEHLGNSHKPFIKIQGEELKNLNRELETFWLLMADIIGYDHKNKIKNLNNIEKNILDLLNNMEVAQIKRIKTKQVNTRNSILFLNTLSETKNMLNHASGLFNSYINLTTNLKK